MRAFFHAAPSQCRTVPPSPTIHASVLERPHIARSVLPTGWGLSHSHDGPGGAWPPPYSPTTGPAFGPDGAGDDACAGGAGTSWPTSWTETPQPAKSMEIPR